MHNFPQLTEMKKYNFDKIIDRHGTGSIMTDCMNKVFGREDLCPLWIADMDFEVCPAISDAIEKRASHHIYGYSQAPDSYWDSIINWIKLRHNWDVAREELTHVNGVVRGYAYALNFFTQRGDTIVIQQPVYHPFKNVAIGNHRRVVSNDLIKNGDSYTMDLAGLEHIFATESPKLMVLCNPHNPIGICWDKESLQEVARLARKYNVIVVSDEIHSDLGIFGHKHTPFASVNEDAAAVSISFGAPSKTFNIPGVCSSWCVVKNPELRKPFFEWLQVNEFSVPTWFATEATEAAYTHGEEWLNELIPYIEDNILAVEEYCKNNLPEVHPVRPQASFLIWLDCTKLGLTHDRLIDLFVNRAHLALNDGEMFGKGGEGHMRLNIANPREMIINALEQLKEAISSIDNKK